jgi:rSAM/selenodomain-associated transferase 1
MHRALIVVAKEPTPGSTKTRLVPPLTHQQAAEVYRCLLVDTLDIMGRVAGVQPVIAYHPPQAQGYFRALASQGFALIAQQGQTLGQRLDNVLRAHLEQGYNQAVVMNSDAPTLPVACLEQAFAALDDPQVDVVLGPTEDGGYYLIGLKQPCSAIFDVVMSTPTVLQETLDLVRQQGLRARCLPTWHDIDNGGDLERLREELAGLGDEVAVHTRGFLRGWGIMEQEAGSR